MQRYSAYNSDAFLRSMENENFGLARNPNSADEVLRVLDFPL